MYRSRDFQQSVLYWKGKREPCQADSALALLQSVWVKLGLGEGCRGRFSKVFGISWGEETWHDFWMRKPLRLQDTYRFPGFRPQATVRGIFGDPKARIVSLRRLRKKRPVAAVGSPIELSTTTRSAGSATCPVATRACTWRSRCDASAAAGAAP